MIKLLKNYFLAILLTSFAFNPATFAQALADSDASRAASTAAGNSTRPAPSDAIDSFTSRIAAEGYDRVWQMTGPFGGDVTALTIDPHNADRVWLGTSDGQIFRSTDGGVIWKRIRPGIKAPGFIVTNILFDREKSGVIYAGVKPRLNLMAEETNGGGVFVSEDDGENWREMEGMRGRSVRGLVQAAKDPNVLAAAARDGIYVTKDRGKTWERITPANDAELKGFHSVAIDPRDTNVIYVGTHHLPWKTADCGQNWKRAGSKETGMIDDSDIMAIHIDESNPDIVLMSACSGIYRSVDASAKWAKIQGIPYTSRRTHVIYQHPTRPEVIFAGTTEGLWLSTDNGKPDSWRRMTSVRLVINAIAIHPDRPDRVFLGTEDNGVLVSNDGGESYEGSNAGFINRQVRAVLADRKERGRIYAGVIFDRVNGGLFVSEDGGITWNQSMNGMGVRDVHSLYQSESNPATIYAGTNHGLFRSDDHGNNWAPVKKETPEEQNSGKDKAESSTGAPASSQPSAQAPEPPAQPAAQLDQTSPRPRRVVGDTTPPPQENPVKPVVQTRSKPNPKKSASANKSRKKASVRVGTKSRNKRATTASKSKSKQEKAPPAPTDGLVELQSQVFAIASLTPLNANSADNGASDNPQPQPNWLMVSTWDGMFFAEDEKKGWKEIKLRQANAAQPKINVIATSPHAPGTIFVGTDEGLFVSRNNGVSFKLMLQDEEAQRVRSIVFDPRTAETVYVGTSKGFFRSLDGGRNWENRGGGMPLLTDVSAIVISAADPDELYLCDEMRGTFYHSKDRGWSWERLDISQLPSLKLWSLVSDPFDANRIYAGSFSGGVYVMSRK
jgi:photosystem II stability/assembly factor-like uncharacterized protein